MHKKLLSLTLILLTIATLGCTNSDNKEQTQENSTIVLGEHYREKTGDQYTISSTTNISYSNGQSENRDSTDVIAYSTINEIPSKYGYSNAISAPYILRTITKDGVIDGIEYQTASGDTLIDDYLIYYQNIEYTIQNGSEDLGNLSIDDEFTAHKNATLFNPQSGEEYGYIIYNVDFAVLNEEEITVPAGTFNSVKVEFRKSGTLSVNDVTDTFSLTGHIWIDTNKSITLKVYNDAYITLNKDNLTAEFTSEDVLTSYIISQDNHSSVKSNKSSPAKDINIRHVLSSLNKTSGATASSIINRLR